MLTFTGYISEVAIKARGSEGDRHAGKYITPYLPGGEHHGEGTHTTASDIGDIPKGTSVTLHGHQVINGVHHAVISAEGSDKKVTVPVSKLHKPKGSTKAENRGHQYEKQFFERMQNHGLVPEGHKPAGSTPGTDVPILNKKKKSKHQGTVIFNGEVKKGTDAAFGQGTIHHDPAKGGWHVPDSLKAKRPEYAREIERSGVLDYMNKHHPDPNKMESTASGRAKSIRIPHPDLKPAEAYLRDHHVDVVQVGEGKGTYRVGEKDATGHGLPRMEGTGMWTVREKQLGNKRARTVMFQPHGKSGLTPSSVNLDNDQHLEEFKKTLGHK
jgi:hypothetical protein